MAVKPKQMLFAGIAALGLALLPSHLPGCGPYYPEARFTLPAYPRFPPDRYVAGELGVVPTTYARRYLVVAWRYLSGKPLTARERQGAIPGAERKQYDPWVQIGSRIYPAAVKQWTDARARVRPSQPPPDVELERLIPGSNWQRFPNCGEDAFRTAARTLDSRLKTVSDRGQLEDWVAAQDAVFSNCGGPGQMPAEPEPGLNPLLAADRAYQTAAAHFYRMEFDPARKDFLAIAADKSSPWAPVAPYIAVRCLVRQGTLPAELNIELLERAAEELRAIIDDPDHREIHPAAESLLSYVSLRTEPADRLDELSDALSNPAKDANFTDNLIDYEYLMDRLASTLAGDLETASEYPELTYWIANYQTSSEQARQAALKMWRKTRTLPWLIASISKLQAGDAPVGEIVTAAAKVPVDSPAYPTLAYNRVRLLLGGGYRDAARDLLDADLPHFRKTLAPDSLNLFLAWRMQLARNLTEFLEFAPRRPADVAWGSRKELPGELFDADSAQVLNERLPLAALSQAATRPMLPAHLRNQVLAAAWTRAVLLENQAAATALSGTLETLHPTLSPYLREYSVASGPDERRFAAAWLFLKHPGLQPYISAGMEHRMGSRLNALEDIRRLDVLRNNWWCAFVPGKMQDRSLSRYWQREREREAAETGAQPADFLTEPERSQFRPEWARLKKLDTAPTYLGRIVVSWVRNHPGDPRGAEALHLTVRATRLGCANSETWQVSKDAFELLHAKYPGSRWAKATKYWYR